MTDRHLKLNSWSHIITLTVSSATTSGGASSITGLSTTVGTFPVFHSYTVAFPFFWTNRRVGRTSSDLKKKKKKSKIALLLEHHIRAMLEFNHRHDFRCLKVNQCSIRNDRKSHSPVTNKVYEGCVKFYSFIQTGCFFTSSF